MWDRLIYISGPYRAPTPEGVQANIDRADAAARRLRSLGWGVICPHKNSEGDDDDEACLAADLAIIDRLDLQTDAIYMLEGWEQSAGSCAEEWRAFTRGLRHFYQGLDEPPDLREPLEPCPNQREQTLEVLRMLTTFIENCATVDSMKGDIHMDLREVPATGEFREFGTFGIESATITIRGGHYAQPDLRSAHD
jgi:hypothetical protein